MQELAVYDVKTRLSELLVQVENGAQFIITRRGVAVARLVPAAAASTRRAQNSSQRQKVSDAFGALTQLRSGVTLDVPLRETLEQGRD